MTLIETDRISFLPDLLAQSLTVDTLPPQPLFIQWSRIKVSVVVESLPTALSRANLVNKSMRVGCAMILMLGC